MDWREPGSAATVSQKPTAATSSEQATARWHHLHHQHRHHHHHHHHQNHRRHLERDEEADQHYFRAHHESRSIERHSGYAAELMLQQQQQGHDVVKSKSSSSVDAWAEEARAASEKRSTSSSSRCADGDLAEVHGLPVHGEWVILSELSLPCLDMRFSIVYIGLLMSVINSVIPVSIRSLCREYFSSFLHTDKPRRCSSSDLEKVLDELHNVNRKLI